MKKAAHNSDKRVEKTKTIVNRQERKKLSSRHKYLFFVTFLRVFFIFFVMSFFSFVLKFNDYISFYLAGSSGAYDFFFLWFRARGSFRFVVRSQCEKRDYSNDYYDENNDDMEFSLLTQVEPSQTIQISKKKKHDVTINSGVWWNDISTSRCVCVANQFRGLFCSGRVFEFVPTWRFSHSATSFFLLYLRR